MMASIGAIHEELNSMKPKLVLCGSAINKAKTVNLGNITSNGSQAQMIDREDSVCPIVNVGHPENQTTTDGIGGVGLPVQQNKGFSAPAGGRGNRSSANSGRGRSPKNR